MQLTHACSRFGRGLSGSRLSVWVGFASLLLITAVVSSTRAFDENKSTERNLGLHGILPDQVPDSLSAEALSVLDGNWAEWSSVVADLVNKLYQDETLDAAGQRKVIESLKSKLGVIQKALQDDRYQSIFDRLVILNGTLTRRVEVAEAVLDTLDQGPAIRIARLNSARRDLDSAIQNLQAYLAPMRNGDGWLKYLRTTELEAFTTDPNSSSISIPLLLSVQRKFNADDNTTTAAQRGFLDRSQLSGFKSSLSTYLAAVRVLNKPVEDRQLRNVLADLLSALDHYETSNSTTDANRVRTVFKQLQEIALDDGDRISEALRSQYFNYNLRIVASEEFLNKLIQDERDENGPVDDFILGAKIDGQQTTKTTVGLNLKPSVDGARLRITLNGVSETSTQGVTDQATIFTSGHHTFHATKDVIFDGVQFVAQPAKISVNANNTTTDARTQVSGVPILGSFARGIAMSEARGKRAESEAIARQRVSSRVIPRFNEEVNANFKDANSQLEAKVNTPLKEMSLYPSAVGAYTTEDELRLRTRLMSRGELAGDSPVSKVTSSTGFVVHLHESLMNNSVDRMQLASRTLTEKELMRELEKPLGRILGREVGFDAGSTESDDDGSASFIFHSSDPVRFRVRNGLLELTIQAGLRPGEGKEDIPTQIITVPLSFKVDGDHVVIGRGAVIVSAVEPPKSQFIQITRAAAVKKKIEAALPNRELDRYISIQIEEEKKVDTAISEIKALDGWFSIAFK